MLPLILFFASTFFLVRSILIFLGLQKDPILKSCERYGPQEYLYLPLLPILVWSGGLLFALGWWGWDILRIASPLVFPGIFLVFAAQLGYTYYDITTDIHYRLLKYPRWFYNLREYTTRYERRRIAYAWLRLPWRLRLAYNSNTEAFRVWADFVVMSTVWEVQEDAEKVYGHEP